MERGLTAQPSPLSPLTVDGLRAFRIGHFERKRVGRDGVRYTFGRANVWHYSLSRPSAHEYQIAENMISPVVVGTVHR